MSPTPRRRTGFVLAVLILASSLITGGALWPGDDYAAQPRITKRQALLDVLDGPGNSERNQIDVTLYTPSETPAPVILLPHGFGGDKSSVAGQADELAHRGFAVLTYSARGFGRSTGKIALNAPEYEVNDARQLIDWLARQPEVLRDRDGDPRVGVTGSSYGGALSLLLAGTDPRVDAIAPVMTYNDLTQGLLPNNATTTPPANDTAAHDTLGPDGVFKRSWAGQLFSAAGRKPGGGQRPDGQASGPEADLPGGATCGNFSAPVCAAYTEIAQTGRATQSTLDLLASVSPKSVTHNIKIPTLLVQGERDSLFGLDQADANARQISEAGGKVKMIWYAGGHDGDAPSPALRNRIGDWFAFHLGGVPPVPDPRTGFEYDIPGKRRPDGDIPIRTLALPEYPGLRNDRTPRISLPLHGASAQVINPPGGNPASMSSLPGTAQAQDAADRLGQTLAQDVPGQVAIFRTDPVNRQVIISGIPQTRLSVASVPGEPTQGDAVLYAKLYDAGPDGRRVLIGNSVSPLHVTGLPADGTPVEFNVALPGMVHQLQAEHHLELAVASTDQSYANPIEPSVHRVALAGGQALSVPSLHGSTVATGTTPVTALAGLGVIALIMLLGWGIGAIRRRIPDDHDSNLVHTPLVISGLSKSYPGKLKALRELDMRIEPGQVVGLLGPHGAGKTTTLRMLLGLLRPSSGEIRIFGHRVSPGAPVLSRVGSFVEGPGLLPHLSGVDNLRSYWTATGRPVHHAKFDEAVAIAGLGDAAQRKVRTYSQGMKQRLAIAQAMLGLPDLLVLDEPTNGLDPPQIHQMREVLHRYAATGRSVLVSSHLLSEVEQTCTHIVVMHQGKLVAAGSVEEIVSVGGEATFTVDEPDEAVAALRSLEGFGPVEADGNRVHADLAGHTTAVAVNALVASGVSVSQVGPRRRLEDAFLELVGEERRT